MNTDPLSQPLAQRLLLIGLIGMGAITGLLGIDLILPAVPQLPAVFGTTPTAVQFVLAAYVLGSGAGLLIFGDLASRYDRGYLLVLSMGGFGLASWMATTASDITVLIGWRFLQGLLGSAPAVMAPGLIRRLFSERGAVQAIGTLGSIESVVPALAPIIGAWLLTLGDWTLNFTICAIIGLTLAVIFIPARRLLPPGPARARSGRYRQLLANRGFLTTAFSHAFSLGAILVFVFSAPAVITGTMDGTLSDFIRMQVVGISTFIIAANVGPRYVLTIGARKMMFLGSAIGLIGFALIIWILVLGGADPFWLTPTFVLVNFGFGIRGPITFHQAIVAADGDDNRGSSLLMLFIMGVTGAGTALVAPMIEWGIGALTCTALAFHLIALGLTFAMPRSHRGEA